MSQLCQDPCSVRGACGDSALCGVVMHKARCSCPQCYVGRPTVQCVPDPRCDHSPPPSTKPLQPLQPPPALETTTTAPQTAATLPTKPMTSEGSSDTMAMMPMIKPAPAPPVAPVVAGCTSNGDCHASQACNQAVGACQDPCDFQNKVCDQGKRCQVRQHRPLCVCKYGFVLSDAGEMACGPDPIECRADDDCASNLACIGGKCKSPCAVRNPCAASEKTCLVLDHRSVCVCIEGCEVSASICLRDRGCPANMACVDFQCRNPCDNLTCAGNRPCYVEEHKAVCKFCPAGFTVDQQYGCIKGISINTSRSSSSSSSRNK